MVTAFKGSNFVIFGITGNALMLLLDPDMFPDVSYAFTVYRYVVPASNCLSVKLVLIESPTLFPSLSIR